MPSITLSGLVKDYTPTVRAVDDLDLHIEDGAFVALLGPSGCGKTTTLRMIAGLERPTAGEVRVDDRVLSCSRQLTWVPPEKRGMGLVFQHYALWPHLTVAQNVGFGLEMQRVDKLERHERVRRILDLMRISAEADRYPSQLSGGQQQRVALARMLAVDPEILLLDEPLSNLDAALRLEMRAELKRLHRRLASTVVFVTHDQLEAMTMATQIVVMHDGVLQQYGTPDEVYRRPASRFVAGFVGAPPMNLDAIDGDGLAAELRAVLAASGRPSAALDRATWLGVRPEDLDLVSDQDIERSPQVLPAQVDTVLPTGATWIVALRVGRGEVFVVTSRPPVAGSGARVGLRVDPDTVHAFDSGEQRIRDLDALVTEQVA
jgi:iron(III) transport system ATP-binding protein